MIIWEQISNSILGNIKRLCEINRFKRRWRSQNIHNDILPMNIFPI